MDGRHFKLKRTKHKVTGAVPTTSRLLSKTASGKRENYIERMPPEVILKILAFLDAGSLFCLGFVNKYFSKLANDNGMWHHVYTCYRAKRKTSKIINEVTDGVDLASVQEKPMGYWRRRLFKELAGCGGNWKTKLQSIHPHTGLPRRTAEVLRSAGIQWEISVKDVSRHEKRMKHARLYFSDASLTVSWNLESWPSLDKTITLQLHAVIYVPLTCPPAYRPGRRSLVSEVVLKKDAGKMYASDKVVRLLYIEPGVSLGIWQDHQKPAFLIMNLHYHRLVERSFLGSFTMAYQVSDVKAQFDDVDPEYGLHGYTVHIELHNTVQNLVSCRFNQLFCRRDQITDGYVPLHVISKGNRSHHVPFCGDIKLPWRTEVLQGCIQHCCMLTLTIFDEAQTPFWCVSAPVSMAKSKQAGVMYDCSGESFSIHYQDSEGKLKMEVMEAQKQYSMVQLAVFLSVNKVNEHFGSDY